MKMNANFQFGNLGFNALYNAAFLMFRPSQIKSNPCYLEILFNYHTDTQPNIFEPRKKCSNMDFNHVILKNNVYVIL